MVISSYRPCEWPHYDSNLQEVNVSVAGWKKKFEEEKPRRESREIRENGVYAFSKTNQPKISNVSLRELNSWQRVILFMRWKNGEEGGEKGRELFLFWPCMQQKFSWSLNAFKSSICILTISLFSEKIKQEEKAGIRGLWKYFPWKKHGLRSVFLYPHE